MKNHSGFTLIETIVYVALLGLLLTGAVMAAYQILQGSTVQSTKTSVQDEGDFVIRKLAWALSGASDITGSGSSLTVTRYDLNTVDFSLGGGAVRLRESAMGGVAVPITTSNVVVQTMVFTVTGSNPKQLTMTMTLKTANGTDAPQTFTLSRYIRK